MSHIAFHPAPGFGELLPGNFVVPQNPLRPVSYVPHIGELLPGRFSVPENPIVRELSGLSSLRPGGSRTASMGELSGTCGCTAGMCGEGCEGLGILGLESLGGILPLALGGLALLWMFARPGGKGYRQERERAETQYRSTVAGIKRKHRGYRRIARGAAGAAQRGLQAVQGA